MAWKLLQRVVAAKHDPQMQGNLASAKLRGVSARITDALCSVAEICHLIREDDGTSEKSKTGRAVLTRC